MDLRSHFSQLVPMLMFLTVLGTGNAQTEIVLHRFPGSPDGANPMAGLTFDSHGNLFGTTMSGGSAGNGSIFKLSPSSGGDWTYQRIYSFSGTGNGQFPMAGVVMDSHGNLVGTTFRGGATGNGTVFQLSPTLTGGWREKVLYSFQGGSDGAWPYGAVAFDTHGTLYGTTNIGGANNTGTVFQLKPNGGAAWSETVLHSFGSGADGASPFAGLVFDRAGNLYGTTDSGGSLGCGTVFQLSPVGGGGWTESVIFNFCGGTSGCNPVDSLILDAAGNLYGTTLGGGAAPNFGGTVFELSPIVGGGWSETNLYEFGGANGDPIQPQAGLSFDPLGNLYGTSEQGGAHNFGTVFKLSLGSGGTWTETTLTSFTTTNGQYPVGSVVLDSAGNIYGTTKLGGGSAAKQGVVFEVMP